MLFDDLVFVVKYFKSTHNLIDEKHLTQSTFDSMSENNFKNFLKWQGGR